MPGTHAEKIEVPEGVSFEAAAASASASVTAWQAGSYILSHQMLAA